MIYEISLMNLVFAKDDDDDDGDEYGESGDEITAPLASLKELMDKLISGLIKQNKDNGGFQVAKNTVIVLHKVLTAKDKEEINNWSFKGNFLPGGFLMELYNSSKDESCYTAMVEAHDLFLGRCLELASGAAPEIFESVRKFCSNNKLPEDKQLGSLSLKLR